MLRIPLYLLFPAQAILPAWLLRQTDIEFLIWMRGTFHGISLPVPDLQNFCGNVFSAWFHDLEIFSDRKFISLPDPDKPFTVTLFHDSDISVFFDIGIAVIDLCILSGFSVKESASILPHLRKFFKKKRYLRNNRVL